ncbi:2-hydroxyacid dehydrogenase [bacterium SCSIO 12741]|nr:2-hydroxyacid dehydrogenase [bacterium SCSIO 12741]
MAQSRILFIDSVHPILKNELESMGFECHWHVDHSQEQIQAEIADYVGVVIRSKFPMNREMIDRAKQLRFIARSGAGMENIDVEYAREKGIHLFNSPEGNRDAVGEQAVGMLLSLMQNLRQADQQVRQGIWDREGNRGIELMGRHVGLIGYGNMGQAFARRLSGFGVKTLAYDKYKKEYSDSFATEATLNELFVKAEVISFHVPQTDETIYYLDDDFVSSMENPFFLINTARGKVVQTDALVRGLQSGKILGACLDVLEYESSSFGDIFQLEMPDAMKYLIESDRVILSPHVAGWTVESYEKLSTFLAEKVRNAIKEDPDWIPGLA